MKNPDLDRELEALVEEYLDTARLSRDTCAHALRLAFLRGRASAFEHILRNELDSMIVQSADGLPS